MSPSHPGLLKGSHFRGQHADSDEGKEVFVGCEDVMVTGSATKISSAPDASDGGDAAEFDVAARLLTRHIAEHGSTSDWTGLTPPPETPGSAAVRHRESSADAAHGAGDSVMEQEVAGALGFDRKPPNCEWTCNDGSLPLYGWWPCTCAPRRLSALPATRARRRGTDLRCRAHRRRGPA